jgi:hypothetical protein
MAKANGFVVSLSQARMDTLRENVGWGSSFAEPVDDFEHSRNTPLVCFIINDGTLVYIGLGRRGLRAGTGLVRLNIENITRLSESLPVQKIIDHLPRQTATFVRDRFQSGGILTENSFFAVIDAIRRLDQTVSALLERFSQAREERIQRLSDKVKNNLAQQKEAVLTALLIAGLDRESVQEWMPPEEAQKSFLDGLPNICLREDSMVVHDMHHLPGFEEIETCSYSAAIFKSKTTSERLTVILANRLPLEKQTGTDLIYFNETYKSFIMVQYKAMERENRKNGQSQDIFRLPDTQLKEEIDRMDTLLDKIKVCKSSEEIDAFRLTENPFFIKLCPRFVFDSDSASLVRGMYFPLVYWKWLEKNPAIEGPRGGLGVTFDNAKRYFDNTAFSMMVSKAWVGTTPSQSQVLQDVIRETLKTGKALAIAIKPKNPPNHVDDKEIERKALDD